MPVLVPECIRRERSRRAHRIVSRLDCSPTPRLVKGILVSGFLRMHPLTVLFYFFIAGLIQVGMAMLAFRHLDWPIWIPLALLGIVLFGPNTKAQAATDYLLWLFAMYGIATVFFQ